MDERDIVEVILLERVARLGSLGDIVKVKDGHARNFLLPFNKALRATPENKRKFEKEKNVLAARNAEKIDNAYVIAEQLCDRVFVVIRSAGRVGQLYGSVSTRDIAELISADLGASLDSSQIILTAPIKSLGVFPAVVRLHPEVEVKISLNVASSEEEAERQTAEKDDSSKQGQDL